MPDPVSSSSVPPNSSDAVCSFGDDPSLTCQAPMASVPASQSAAPNSCEPPAPSAEPAVSSASSDLAQKFSNNDHSVLIATSRTISAANGFATVTKRPDQLDVQVGLPRFERHDAFGELHVTTNIDLYNASAHLGSLNEDGSHGENIGAGVNRLNGELTLDYKGWSLSVGVGSSVGGSISSGEGRDLDGDGIPERCFKMTLGPYTLGECDEL
jgi:hypothetical protein